MKKISNLLMMALLTVGMGLTSCDEQLDNAVNPGVMPDVDDVTPTVEDIIKYGFKVTDLAGADKTEAVTSLKMSKAAAGVPAFCTMNEDERCVFFEAPASWGSQINVWAWMNGGDGKDYLGTNWPGVTATKLGTADNGNSVWKWNVSGSVNPDNIIFNDGSKQTADLKFTNGGYYVGTEGLKATVTPEYEAEVSGGKITIKAEKLSEITAAADFWFEAEIGGKPYVAKVNIDPATLSPETDKTLEMATVGDVILSDGKFAKAGTASPVAMIAYLGNSDCTHGLAIQLNDSPVKKTWAEAKTYAAGLPAVPGGTWRLPWREDWQKMFVGCAVDGDASASDYMSPIAGFKAKITATGTTWQSDNYWSSTEGSSGAWEVFVNLGGSNAYASFDKVGTSLERRVLGCLAF